MEPQQFARKQTLSLSWKKLPTTVRKRYAVAEGKEEKKKKQERHCKVEDIRGSAKGRKGEWNKEFRKT